MAGGQNRLIGKLDNKDLLHTREARVRRNLVQGDNKHIKSYRSLEARVRRMWHATDTSDSQLLSRNVLCLLQALVGHRASGPTVVLGSHNTGIPSHGTGRPQHMLWLSAFQKTCFSLLDIHDDFNYMSAKSYFPSESKNALLKVNNI